MEAMVRAGDRDRYFAVLFAPAPVRGALLALHAYDLTLRDIIRTTTDPHLGLIRLAWWRDAVSDEPVAGQPVLAALSKARIDSGRSVALAEAYMDRIEGKAAGETGALLFDTAAHLLKVGSDPQVAAAGRYWDAACDLRAGGRTGAPPLPKERAPADIRPITAIAAAARRDFAGKHEPRGVTGRQIAMLRHLLTGRF